MEEMINSLTASLTVASVSFKCRIGLRIPLSRSRARLLLVVPVDSKGGFQMSLKHQSTGIHNKNEEGVGRSTIIIVENVI